MASWSVGRPGGRLQPLAPTVANRPTLNAGRRRQCNWESAPAVPGASQSQRQSRDLSGRPHARARVHALVVVVAVASTVVAVVVVVTTWARLGIQSAHRQHPCGARRSGATLI